MRAACVQAARGRMQPAYDRMQAAYDGNAACMQPALPSKCEHLRWITVSNSRRRRRAAGRRRVDALHAVCIQGVLYARN